MPNWSSNALIVKSNGSKEADRDLANFLERIHAAKDDREHGILNPFIPCPPALLAGEGWYDWRIKNWGTKWDVGYDNVTFVTENHMTFKTAWSPPMKWIETVSKEYPRLVFEVAYSEQGMAFAGVAEIQDGETISEDEIADVGHVDQDDWLEANPGKTEDEWYEEAVLPEWKAHMDKYKIGMGG